MIQVLNALIVDDEPLARDELAYLLKRTKQAEVIGEADSVESALKIVSQQEIDVIFLDIQLADESGLELATSLNKLERAPLIVFATAFDEYALKAFELNAIDYLLKPFEEKRVQQTIEKILNNLGNKVPKASIATKKQIWMNGRADRLALTVEEKIVLLDIKEILYLMASEGTTTIATEKQSYKVNEPLVNFERKLEHTSIIRVHRSYLVNIDGIVEIEPWFHSTYNLIMRDGEKVPVSRTYVKDLKQLLGF